MDTNPLLTALRSYAASVGGQLSHEQFDGFLESVLTDSSNFEVFDENTGQIKTNYKATALYSGTVDGVYSGAIAKNLGDRSGGQIRVLDNTKAGRLLIALTTLPADGGVDLSQITSDNDAFRTAGEKFGAYSSGEI